MILQQWIFHFFFLQTDQDKKKLILLKLSGDVAQLLIDTDDNIKCDRTIDDNPIVLRP